MFLQYVILLATWSQAFGAKTSSPLHIYTRSDACGAAEIWAKFFGKKQEDLLGVGVFGDPGLAQAVKKDPLGIGYNNIGYVYDAATRQQIKGLKVVPIDLNNNGKIDSDEDFYTSMDDLIAAIASGRSKKSVSRLSRGRLRSVLRALLMLNMWRALPDIGVCGLRRWPA